MRYYIIAGEASGDLHASNLIREISKLDKDAEFRAWGGEHIMSTGVELVRHYKDTAFMGFVEVVKNLSKILGFLRQCKKDILEWSPDAVILIDYPGFNFRIAEFTHTQNIKTIYYISPQLWAWKSSRIKKLRKWVDKLLVILPFEQAYYEQRDMEAHFVGHPLLDEVTKSDGFTQIKSDRPIIALLPGSRTQEIKRMLPEMLKVAEQFPAYSFIVAGLSSVDKNLYLSIPEHKNVQLIYNRTYDILSSAQAAIVTSGTATLETALFNVPQVVVYKGGRINYEIGKRLVKVNYISLVNLILDREAVRELIQNMMRPDTIALELQKIMAQPEYRTALLNAYSELHQLLGSAGASERAAKIITDFTENVSR